MMQKTLTMPFLFGYWKMEIMRLGFILPIVTHYLEKGTALDKEAYDRATSVYLVDRTIPMLPERLSNFLCSLRPNEDKLCYSAIFVISKESEVIEQWFGRTVIHSDKRFTYEEAQELIESNNGDFAEELTLLNALSKNYGKEGVKRVRSVLKR